MADEEQTEEKSGGKSKLLIFIILGVVLIAVSVGGTIAALKILSPPPPPATEEGAEAEPEEEVKQKAIYYQLKPKIIVNFNARGRQRYIQADMTFLVREQDVVDAIELHMPMIRNTINMVMSGQTYQEIQTAEGKEYMRQQCLLALRENLETEIGKPGIEQVLFTNLVMQ